jgi:flagellar hook-associated protein 3 FlgL
MRISTSNFYNNTTNQLNELQSSISNLSTQVSTGKKGITPQDDPAAAVKILSLTQAQSMDAQYVKNRVALNNTLGVATSALNSMLENLQNINEEIIAAKTGSYSSQDRATIATSLKGQLDTMIALANANDGAGNYLFSGFNVANSPSEKLATPLTTLVGGTPVNYDTYEYNGTDTSAQIQVDTGRSAGLNVTAKDLFGSGSNNFLDLLSKTIAVMNTPNNTFNEADTALDALANSFKSTFDNVLLAQSKVGITQNQMAELDIISTQRNNGTSKVLSSLEDTDYNKALSDLARQQVQLQAAQKSFQQISSLSLFNYIN